MPLQRCNCVNGEAIVNFGRQQGRDLRENRVHAMDYGECLHPRARTLFDIKPLIEQEINSKN
jgi:hypothetical protein